MGPMGGPMGMPANIPAGWGNLKGPWLMSSQHPAANAPWAPRPEASPAHSVELNMRPKHLAEVTEIRCLTLREESASKGLNERQVHDLIHQLQDLSVISPKSKVSPFFSSYLVSRSSPRILVLSFCSASISAEPSSTLRLRKTKTLKRRESFCASPLEAPSASPRSDATAGSGS